MIVQKGVIGLLLAIVGVYLMAENMLLNVSICGYSVYYKINSFTYSNNVFNFFVKCILKILIRLNILPNVHDSSHF